MLLTGILAESAEVAVRAGVAQPLAILFESGALLPPNVLLCNQSDGQPITSFHFMQIIYELYVAPVKNAAACLLANVCNGVGGNFLTCIFDTYRFISTILLCSTFKEFRI